MDGFVGCSVRDVVFGVEGAGVGVGVLDDTVLAQPALFAVEVALFRLVESLTAPILQAADQPMPSTPLASVLRLVYARESVIGRAGAGNCKSVAEVW